MLDETLERRQRCGGGDLRRPRPPVRRRWHVERRRGLGHRGRPVASARRRWPSSRSANACSALLDVGGDVVELDHPLEHPFLEHLDFVLGGLHLLLHRLVFAVGLDRHQLVPVLRETALVQREFLLDVPSGGLVRRQALPLVVEGLLGGGEPGVEFLVTRGFVGDGAARRFGGRFQGLEVNQAIEVGMHRVLVGPPGFEPGTGRL